MRPASIIRGLCFLQDAKTDLKRYKKYILECQNQERIAVAKLHEVEKQVLVQGAVIIYNGL